MSVTACNKKATAYHLQCSTTGVFMSDATPDFRVLAITNDASRAFQFPHEDAVSHGRKFVKSLYPSFDWKAVPVEVEQQQCVFLSAENC